MLTQYAFSILFIDKKKAKFSNDRFGFNGNCYRLFSFWDTETETLIIATHGIVKKTQKTPSKEITKAEEIRKLYFEQKDK